MPDYRSKLQKLLRDLFEFDSADLDFDFYTQETNGGPVADLSPVATFKVQDGDADHLRKLTSLRAVRDPLLCNPVAVYDDFFNRRFKIR